MEFLGVGYQEILLVLVLLFVVVGPQRLPLVAYQIGRAVRQLQRYARAVRDEFSEEYQYIEEQYSTIKGDLGGASKDLQEIRRELRQEEATLNRELTDATKPVEEAVKSLETPAPVGTTVNVPRPGTNGAAEAATPEKEAADEKPPLVF